MSFNISIFDEIFQLKIGFVVAEKTLRGFCKTTLPTHGQVLSRLMHLYLVDKLKLKKCIDHIVIELMSIWSNFAVIIKAKKRVKSNTEKLYSDYNSLKKNRDRRSDKQAENEANFKLKFPKLFDIAHAGKFGASCDQKKVS